MLLLISGPSFLCTLNNFVVIIFAIILFTKWFLPHLTIPLWSMSFNFFCFSFKLLLNQISVKVLAETDTTLTCHILKLSSKSSALTVFVELGTNPLKNSGIDNGAFQGMKKLSYIRIADTDITAIPQGNRKFSKAI